MDKHKLLAQWLVDYYFMKSNLRLGQAFCNRFIPDIAWSELYYEIDDRKSIVMIYEYVDKNDLA